MSRIAPPPSPSVAFGEDDSVARARFRMRQFVLAAATIAFSVWCWMRSPLLGAIMTFMTKHILVGIITAGLHYPPPPASRPSSPASES